MLPANGAISSLVKAHLIANPDQIILIAAALFLSFTAVEFSALLTSAVKLALKHHAMFRLTQVSGPDMFIALTRILSVAALALVTPALFLRWANAGKLPGLLIFYILHP